MHFIVCSGDHDMAFPYVGVEQWIALLNISVETPWAPFFIKGYGYVGGYETKYAQKDFSLTFATVRGAGHSVPVYKPEESFDVVSRWLTSQNYSRSSRMQEGRAIYAAST
ncbi:putative peptidase S10, serine carboxypeptidase, alpha/Beta hydrolase [Helianthus annuus]|nr:putative peptidase S10, serine carboxypeptidase, alpha/Beta hydrolase [Helianthus annuus]KAJ0879157.1 putative peptidase S10, serine carboxypeptidase, alpha/Beta hydrolase [Helianthus annuus]